MIAGPSGGETPLLIVCVVETFFGFLQELPIAFGAMLGKKKTLSRERISTFVRGLLCPVALCVPL
jgi:hypothetical protein